MKNICRFMLLVFLAVPTGHPALAVDFDAGQPENMKTISKDKVQGATHKIVDVMQVSVDEPASGIKPVILPKGKKNAVVVPCDILIAGGGTGGVAAALSACQAGKASGVKVCLIEETDWLGGQMTAQGVSALDENRMVEKSGAARRYQNLRKAIRNYYASNYKLSADAACAEYLNPGACWVSWLAFEPKVALAEINALLKPFVDQGVLQIYLRTKACAAKTTGTKIKNVTALELDDGKLLEFRAKIFVDATELGDLLPLASVKYKSGVESKTDTGEAHAPELADPENVQDFVFPFVVELCPGENHVIPKPPHYDEFARQGKFSFDGYKMFGESERTEADGTKRSLLPFWEYRRLIQKSIFDDPRFPNDIAMINWDSNDLRGQNIIDKEADQESQRLALGKALSLGFLYWLQTEAPRDDGGKGYPELSLRTDILGTSDGLSKYPYIRESRRIVAKETVVEQDIARATNACARARLFADACGIGFYPIDIHGKQDVPGAGQLSNPFQVPLGALIPRECKNLIASAKNIGVTHVTNGAYRLHPIEWAIGEAAGILAFASVSSKKAPAAFYEKRNLTRLLQKSLIEAGSPVYWFDDICTDDPDFAAIQYLAVTGVMPGSSLNLSFFAQDPMIASDACRAIAVMLRVSDKKALALMPSDVNLEEPLTASALKAICVKAGLGEAPIECAGDIVSRREFARWAYTVCSSKEFFGKI